MKVLALVLLLIAGALGELRAEERSDVQRTVPAARYSLASMHPAVIRAAFSVYGKSSTRWARVEREPPQLLSKAER
jgi:hypothetical protein